MAVSILKGISQIMLQENVWTGFLFLVGIFYGSVQMGLAVLLATFIGTLTAVLLEYDREHIRKGLYGFNPALIGVAMILFFKANWLIWLLIILLSVVATLVQRFFMQKKITAFTLPFVLITWLAIILFRYFNESYFLPVSDIFIPKNEFWLFPLKGYGQVIFQGNLFPGILFFLAVLLSASRAAWLALAMAFLGGLSALLFHFPEAMVGFGLFSFNAVLCTLVFPDNIRQNLVWIILSVSLSLILSFLFVHYELPQLTFPFVAASMCTLFIKKSFSKTK